MTAVRFKAPPTVASFMKSDAFFRLIAGPVGSGKTTGCIFELLRRSCEQTPGADGLRRTRWAIVRQTLQQLKMTVLKDIEAWLQGLVQFKVSESTIHVNFGDVRSEWLLIPLEDPEDQKRLLSSQLTGAWMSECIEIDVGLVPAIQGRCGRYPSAADGGATWFGVIADTNMPVDGSDWHKLMAVEIPTDWQIFIQPGGLEPNAENLNFLTQTPESLKLPVDHPDRLEQGRRYYERLARGNSDDWVRRYVHAKYGNDPSGTAVFATTFNRKFHVTDELIPVHGHPLMVSQDFGRNPCALICQVDHRGRLLVLEELISEGMGLELHVDTTLRPALLQERFAGRQVYVIGDPSGIAQGNIYEETSFGYLKRAGFKGYPAPTNNLDKRLRAVEACLLGARGGGPAILIDGPKCPKLVRACDGMYRYQKMKSGQMAPLPMKNHPWSDVADALQYACLVAHGGYSNYITSKINRASAMPNVPQFSSAGWT